MSGSPDLARTALMYSSDVATALPIHCLSVSHRGAPDEVRERLAFSADALGPALASARRDPGIERLVIISTCHRVELYAALPTGTMGIVDGRAQLIAWLAGSRGVDVADVAPHAVYLQGPAAVRHLCRVACGLDAAILGEAQVLSQVAGAIRQSVAAHAATPLLKDVFRSAVGVGERARRAVWAGYRAADIGSASADGADERLGGLAGVAAVVVGAGEVAELALRALHARSVGRLTVLNRSLSRGEEIAERHGADSAGLEALPLALCEADVVVVATGAPSVVVDARMVEDALATRPDRPLVIVDAALPRNVDPAVRALAGAHLLDLNDLRPLFARASDERHEAIAAVESLIDGEVQALVTRRKSWRGASTARPVGETPWLASA